MSEIREMTPWMGFYQNLSPNSAYKAYKISSVQKCFQVCRAIMTNIRDLTLEWKKRIVFEIKGVTLDLLIGGTIGISIASLSVSYVLIQWVLLHIWTVCLLRLLQNLNFLLKEDFFRPMIELAFERCLSQTLSINSGWQLLLCGIGAYLVSSYAIQRGENLQAIERASQSRYAFHGEAGGLLFEGRYPVFRRPLRREAYRLFASLIKASIPIITMVSLADICIVSQGRIKMVPQTVFFARRFLKSHRSLAAGDGGLKEVQLESDLMERVWIVLRAFLFLNTMIYFLNGDRCRVTPRGIYELPNPQALSRRSELIVIMMIIAVAIQAILTIACFKYANMSLFSSRKFFLVTTAGTVMIPILGATLGGIVGRRV